MSELLYHIRRLGRIISELIDLYDIYDRQGLRPGLRGDWFWIGLARLTRSKEASK